jgi:hypothetical protein
MGVLHIILKVGHPKIISTQISEQNNLLWFLSHNIPKQNKMAKKISPMSRLTYILGFSVKFSFQPIYTDYTNGHILIKDHI